MLSTALVETLGIGAVLPFMRVAIDPEAVSGTGWLPALHRSAGSPDHKTFLVMLGGSLLVIFISKNAYFYWATWVQHSFLMRKRSELVSTLFAGYLRSPYSFHLENNSALLLRNINNVDHVFSGILQPAFTMLTEAMIVGFILGMLLLVEPVLTTAAVVLVALPSIVLQRALRSRLVRLGHLNQELVGKTSKTIIEGLNAVKEVIVSGRSQHFVKTLGDDFQSLGFIRRNLQLAAQSPRLLLEPVLMLGLLAIVFGLTAGGQPNQQLIPLLALFGVATVRAFAAVTKILPGFQQLQFSEAVHQTVVSQLHQFQKPHRAAGAAPAGNVTPEFPVRVSNVTFTYPARSEPAICGVTLALERRSMVGIVGRSGSGKSTLMDLMLGLLTPTEGCIEAGGVDIRRLGSAWNRWVGYIPQSTFLLDDTLRRNIAFGIPDGEIDEAAVVRALAAAQLDEVVRTLPEGLDAVLGERGVRLSGGQRQRVAIARALYHDPKLIFMDEATSALDAETESAVSKALRDLTQDRTLVIIAHRLRTVADCSEIVWLEAGRIREIGKFQELLERSADFRRFADMEFVSQ